MEKYRLKKSIKKYLLYVLMIVNITMFVKCGFNKADYIKGILFFINALYINYKMVK